MEDYTQKLSLEMLCMIMKNLHLRDIMKLECLSRKLQEAVSLHLRLRTKIDFAEGKIYGWMAEGINDEILTTLLQRCPDLEVIHGFHPVNIAKRRQRVDTLSVPGVIAAFKACKKLKQVDTCDIFLLDALLANMPRIEIAKKFCNRNGGFPIPRSNQLTLTAYARITHLSLNGVIIPDLPQLLHVQHLEMQWVKITDPHPFREFGPVRLETFIMRNCAGPIYALKYVPLIAGLASVHSLKTLELVRVPYLGGLIQHVVEDNWRMQSFRHLEKVTLGACRHALELDIGYLSLACALKLRELAIQPSLTKDSLFSSLSMAEAQFPEFETLHLSYVDAFPPPGKWTNEELVSNGLADIVESPAMITDIGMRLAGLVFTKVQALHIYNCPHLCLPMLWLSDSQSWQFLRYLHLRRCHAIRLTEFCKLLPQLPMLETLVLEQMFREPPKGCSRVGLSAGTGLGVSSALVQNTTNEGGNQDIANNNPPAAAANQNIAHDDNDDDEDDMFVNDQNLDAGVNDLEGNDAVDADDLGDDDLEIVEGEVVVLRNCVHYELDVSNPNAVGVGHQNSGAGPSASSEGVHQNTRSGRRSNTRSENENRNDKGDSDDSDSDFDVDVRPVRVETDSPASPTGPNSGNWKGDDCDSDVEESSAKRRSSTKRRSKGKGKGLRGKKGVVKRSKNSQIHQSCQVTSEDIRETTKKAKENGESAKKPKKRDDSHQRKRGRSSKKSRDTLSLDDGDSNTNDGPMPSTSGFSSKSERLGGGATSAGASSSGCDGNQKGVDGKPSQKVAMVDKSTSTSDPVIEEDHRQNLIIRSPQLKNVSLREVGITNLILYDCPKLQSLSGSACRVLRNVQLKNTPYVRNVSFSQCYKLHYGDLIDEVGLLPRTCNRMIAIRPMGNYNRVEMIRFLYRSVLFNGHLCIIHDYCRDPEKSLKNRMRAESWLDLFSSINGNLLDTHGFQQAVNNYEQLLKSYQYFTGADDNDLLTQNPSNRNVYTMKVSSEEGHLDVVTDIPWLRSLATMKSKEPTSSDFYRRNTDASGLYCPEASGHKDAETCINLLEQEIAEARESKMQLYRHMFLVYVNMCDMNGDPLPDRYI